MKSTDFYDHSWKHALPLKAIKKLDDFELLKKRAIRNDRCIICNLNGVAFVTVGVCMHCVFTYLQQRERNAVIKEEGEYRQSLVEGLGVSPKTKDVSVGEFFDSLAY